ncbi:tumor necrosis factor receptor superfamily member 11B-like [Sardina pilchardus]|uniref:tumor necrosis factor receptor superfamily member 11B-like n=1 Tax=Sardina pilchardus TaxID=27697 RepID=UPI002E0E6A33
MTVRNMRPQTTMKIYMFLTASIAWALQPHKYSHRDPVTFELHLCDQCPPGTAVSRHCDGQRRTECSPCPERHFAEQWHWGESCQYCTAVCKEKQLVRQECNATHDQVCECVPGYHLVVEFCVRHTQCLPGSGVTVLGTPESDTACKACPEGYYSSVSSASEPCVPHRNCSMLGYKTLQRGTSTQDVVCENEAVSTECNSLDMQCHTDTLLCEEAIFQFLASPRLASIPLERLLESLPGRRVDWKSVERLKKACSPQQQLLQLLRLWREQNKDQDKLFSIIQGVNVCERKVLRCAGLKNLTLGDLLAVTQSLPGVRVSDEEVRTLVVSCPSQQHILQLLHLWKSRNSERDVGKALAQSLRRLRARGHAVSKRLLKSLKRIARIIGASTMYRLYEKMFFNMIQDSSCFKSKAYND